MASLVVIFLAITAAGISMKGCGDTFASEEEAGTLHGEWFGSHYNEEAGTKPVVKGSIVHSATSDSNISGSMSIDNELYTLSGTYENGTLRATLNNPTAIIFWDGQYQGGRIQGTAYRLSSSTGGMESSLLSLVKFLDIGGVIEMGPWLLLAQDSATGLSSMTIRIALTEEIEHLYDIIPSTHKYGPLEVEVTVTDSTTGAPPRQLQRRPLHYAKEL